MYNLVQTCVQSKVDTSGSLLFSFGSKLSHNIEIIKTIKHLQNPERNLPTLYCQSFNKILRIQPTFRFISQGQSYLHDVVRLELFYFISYQDKYIFGQNPSRTLSTKQKLAAPFFNSYEPKALVLYLILRYQFQVSVTRPFGSLDPSRVYLLEVILHPSCRYLFIDWIASLHRFYIRIFII